MHRVLPRVKMGAVWMLASCLVLPAALEARAEVRLAVSPGVSIPTSRFLDGFAVPVGDTACSVPIEGTNMQLNSYRASVENDTGFSLGLAAIIDGWELGYSFSRYTWGRLTVDGASICIPGGTSETNDIFLGFDEETVLDDFDDADIGALYVHRVVMGYRFYAMDGEFRPYIPLALGPTIMHQEGELVYGGFFQIGLGAEWEFTPGLRASVDVRYVADIMQNPALANTSLRNTAAQNLSGNKSVFENVVEVFQSVLISVSFDYAL